MALSLVWVDTSAPLRAAPPDGEQLYGQYCAQCHSKSRALRAPHFNVLRRMQPQDVLDSLEFGTMRFEGLQRSIDERRAIAEFVTGR
ncbi:MAG: cytochrome c, partial [Deltaproteobacteria bacterium]|nr:cytochrome c [Deltaproteobacteria bacterium]